MYTHVDWEYVCFYFMFSIYYMNESIADVADGREGQKFRNVEGKRREEENSKEEIDSTYIFNKSACLYVLCKLFILLKLHHTTYTIATIIFSYLILNVLKVFSLIWLMK